MLPARDVVVEVGLHIGEVLHRRDIGAGGEGLLVAGKQDRADAGIRVEREQRLAQLGHQPRAERIQLLRPVEGDDADAPLLLRGDEFKAHGCRQPLRKSR
jgi:hypothetical protein